MILNSFFFIFSLLIFYLDDWSVDVSGVLNSYTIIVLLLVSSFMVVIDHFMYLDTSMLGV